ncbi:MAG: response regulator [Bdellovibrionales bacterium]|nr:response regulator [Bdellovibrionales bacterium]
MSDPQSILRVIATDMQRLSGNVFSEKQFKMMDSRIKRRITELGLQSLQDYFHHYTHNRVTEGKVLLSLLTTHHTFFFREFEAFLRLKDLLPELIDSLKAKRRSELRIWSAACSYGHEVYTMAMFLEKHLVRDGKGIDYKILATDIDPEAVKRASNGVYKKLELNKVSLEYSQGSWDKGRGDLADFVRIKKAIRQKCEFKAHNMLESSSHLGKFDVVLARNVLIYFDEGNVSKASKYLLEALEEPGFAICGVSEYLDMAGVKGKKLVGPIYRKGGVEEKVEETVSPAPAAVEVKVNRPKTVVCVDDSRSVLSLLSKILTPDRGFEIIATAADGVEAQSVIKRVKPDLVTLDIHMPRMTGLQYLEQMSSDHPPVLMISSSSREDKESALRALELGASDYVEKPSLQNFKKSQDEICFKLQVLASKGSKKANFDLDQQFASKQYETHEIKKDQWVCLSYHGESSQAKKAAEEMGLPLERTVCVLTKRFENQIEASKVQVTEMTTQNFTGSKGLSEQDNLSIVRPSEIKDLKLAGLEFVYLVVGDARPFFRNLQPHLETQDLIVMQDLDINRSWFDKVRFAVPLTSCSYHVRQLFAEKKREAA